MATKRLHLPSYVNPRTLADGKTIAYYWVRPSWADPALATSPDPKKRARAVRNGKTCPYETTALGTELGEAITRANAINEGFKEWRLGVEVGPTPGTVAWLFSWFRKQDDFKSMRPKTRKAYLDMMNSVEAVPMKTGTFGQRKAKVIDKETADRLYKKIRTGRERQAAYEMSTCRKIWAVASRNTSKTGVSTNPFTKMKLLTKASKGNVAASRAQYEAYKAAARDMGRQSMATAAALLFECCQRVWDAFGFVDPDGLVDRGIKWSGYEPGVSIELVQSKTGNFVRLPLFVMVDGEKVMLYPELEEELAWTPRADGDDGVIVRDERTGKIYNEDYQQKLHRRIRAKAGLPAEIVMTSFRHGGVTEVGDAGNEDVRAVSGHTTLEVTKIYNKANEAKARIIAAKRREHVATLTAGEKKDEA